jgi:hypothetical protein
MLSGFEFYKHIYLDAFGMLFSFEKSGNESYGRNV